MITDDVLDLFKSKYPDSDFENIDLEDVNSGYSIFDEFSENTISLTSESVELELIELKTQILCLNSLAIYCRHFNESERRVVSAEFPANDFHLSAALTNIANTTNSILELCRRGFNTQSGILLRSLSERVMQTIILFNNSSDFSLWFESQESEESKKAFYEVFSKRDRMHKKFEAIESNLLGVDFDFNSLRGMRKSKLEEYSMDVHGSFISVVAGSSSFWGENGDEVNSAIFGQPCITSKKILGATIFEVWYFLKIFRQLLKVTHKWVPDYSNEFVRGFELYRYYAHNLFEERTLSDLEV